MPRYCAVFVSCLLWWTGSAVAAAATPLALHPDNPHYFLWRGKPAVLITSGEHYGALLNLDFDYHRYFAALAADGLNLTRTFSGSYREVDASFRITDNTLAPKPGRFIAPWERSGEPGYVGGGNKFDLTRWDSDYFTRLRDFMTAAQRHGVVVELDVFCTFYNKELWTYSPMNAASNVNGIGRCDFEEALALKENALTRVQLALTRKLVNELKGFDNLYYEVCNEPYFHGVTLEWQHKVAETIAEEERRLGVKHLISMNIANGRQKVEKPHPDVSILNFHYTHPPDTVAMNYGLGRLIGENETGFRGKHDLLYRTEGWDFIIAGGGLYNNLDYSFTAKHPDGTFLDYQSPGGGSPALRKQLGILARFLGSFDFLRMKPDEATLRRISEGLTCRILAERGKAYALYMHVPLPGKPKNIEDHRRSGIEAELELSLPAGDYSVVWTDTKTGATTDGDALAHRGGSVTIRSPKFDDDLACAIRAR